MGQAPNIADEFAVLRSGNVSKLMLLPLKCLSQFLGVDGILLIVVSWLVQHML